MTLARSCRERSVLISFSEKREEFKTKLIIFSENRSKLIFLCNCVQETVSASIAKSVFKRSVFAEIYLFIFIYVSDFMGIVRGTLDRDDRANYYAANFYDNKI